MTDTPYIPLRKRLPWWGWASIAFALLVVFGWMTWAYLPELCVSAAKKNFYRKQAVDLLFSLGPRATNMVFKMEYVIDTAPRSIEIINYENWIFNTIREANMNEEIRTAMLSSFSDINSRDHIYGNTILHLAAYLGADNVVIALIKKGADVNAQANNKQSVLHSACLSGNVNTIKILINAGADINVCDNYGQTPLVSACYSNSLESVSTLIDAGTDVNVIISSGNHHNSLLNYAINNCNSEIIDLLKQHGAKTYKELQQEQQDKKGDSQ